jgi:hypothetical protein
MKDHRYIRMPSGSIVRVEEDRIKEAELENGVMINFALFCVGAFILGFAMLALAR